ncbi:hypothetical protein BP6252_08734 [Coleophoma cylindrospora]|uniref:Uncharacterized protein n=1 Tax=Coleophoma cylindrospora TaxID=1849047 RepID=A0A3D8R7A7_9HELO|nr:hypothetical protein BP6252_08734 [Coleophoma cylindrospora]
MATEATNDIAATPSTIPDDELNKTETKTENAPADVPVLNGVTGGDGIKQESESEAVDGAANSAEVSVSGGSDTEASKTEGAKAQADDKGHARTASTVKKFTSFKPVSVNKTFLAAKSATATAPSKIGDKSTAGTSTTQTGSTATLTARPRLVAKSGSGIGSAAPRTSASANGSKPGAAPDASAVWNKNRPAPAPEPKRFTDEELKQRYGIHLATRLQSDDPGKQATWADIDDDDDDWAPETIEWTDGTKITLPQADDVASTPTPEPEPIPAVKETKAVEAPKPKSPAPIQPASSPTVKTANFGSGRAGLVLKGVAEKPTLVAKPPGPPTPVKSPWAPLPPVDKVAPVNIDLPQAPSQQQQSRFGQRDPHGFQNMPPPPAKEIAADDFSRSWRDSNANTSRELYNSQSGRYEPVNENRRGVARNDPHSRQPAVLQRPGNQDHPEPSAAFQTHRAGNQESSYGRRRTSSNASGGSGLLRRMSRGHDLPPPQELLSTRRGSLAAVSDAPSSPRTYSPSGQHPNQRGYRASPVISHPSPHPVHGQTVPQMLDGQVPSQQTQEEILEEQKKIMRDKREAAIKRRQDEEAKEEAAKKERIRLKLEAMGPAPEPKAKKEDKPSVPTQIQARDPVDATSATGSAKTKPSDSQSNENSPETKTVESRLPSQLPRVNGIHSSSVPPSNSIGSEGRNSQTWQSASSSNPDRFTNWGSAPPQPTSSRNVWGPPTNDRTLGNGTFNPELSRLPEMHPTASNPGPIGPPNATRNNSNGQYQQNRARESYSARPAPIGPPNRHEQQRAAWNTLPEKLAQDDAVLVQQQAEELARRRAMEAAGIVSDVPQPIFKDTWRQVTLNEDGTRSAVQSNTTITHGDSSTKPPAWTQGTADNNKQEAVQPQFNDTWRRAGVEHSGPRADLLASTTINNGSLGGINSTPSRGSRFFPTRDVRLEDPTTTFERPGSPSPPPPTMAGHPAYDGDVSHPHVSLPRPAPVVKLPPAMTPIGPPKPATFAAAIAAPPPQAGNSYAARHDAGGRMPSAQHNPAHPSPGGWQDRINSLIGRKNSPPKSHALAVDSSSKNALELPRPQLVATVSFPAATPGDLLAEDNKVFSKPPAEECFEEQEMGSLPLIRVPNKAPEMAWNLAQPPKSLPRKFMVSHTTTVEPISLGPSHTLIILLPGQTEAKSLNAPSQRQKSNPRRGRGGSSRNPSNPSRGGRTRDASSGFSTPNTEQLTSTNSSPNPSRGSYRGRGANHSGSSWTSRHVSTPVHT